MEINYAVHYTFATYDIYNLLIASTQYLSIFSLSQSIIGDYKVPFVLIDIQFKVASIRQ